MILADSTLRTMVNNGTLSIDPFEDQAIQPASLDLHLGMHFLEVAPDQEVSMGSPVRYLEHWVEDHSEFYIRPKSFLLATTLETVSMPPNVTAFVEGRSSIGRMGLFVQNAGWIDCGFSGEITLELFNATNNVIRLEPLRRVCQLVFALTDCTPDTSYAGKYQHQQGAIGSRIHLDGRPS